jgi:hypothetical protein
MKLKLLSWNVRRLNEGEKRLRIRNLLREEVRYYLSSGDQDGDFCPIVLSVAYGVAVM